MKHKFSKQVKTVPYKVQPKSKTQCDTPAFKNHSNFIPQYQAPQPPVNEADYFTFGGQQSEIKKSKSVHEEKSPKVNKQVTTTRLFTPPKAKIQIFNNNYQIIHFDHQNIEKTNSIQSLQKQFQQIITNQVRTLSSAKKPSGKTLVINNNTQSNYFLTKVKKSTLLGKK